MDELIKECEFQLQLESMNVRCIFDMIRTLAIEIRELKNKEPQLIGGQERWEKIF